MCVMLRSGLSPRHSHCDSGDDFIHFEDRPGSTDGEGCVKFVCVVSECVAWFVV